MELPLYQVDAFAPAPFRGNPAAVVPLEAWLEGTLMQSIAMENNLSETAFVVPLGAGRFELRWFTPACEVDLCGHATLAAAHVLWAHRGETSQRIAFETRAAGELFVERCADGPGYALDFPARPAEREVDPLPVAAALGASPQQVFASARDLLVVFASERDVAALTPDFARVALLAAEGVIATAPADAADVDFVSRFFAPRMGVPEDPATGSAHCVLTPYWAERLGRTRLRAVQIHARRGELECECGPSQGRVRIGGEARTFLSGTVVV